MRPLGAAVICVRSDLVWPVLGDMDEMPVLVHTPPSNMQNINWVKPLFNGPCNILQEDLWTLTADRFATTRDS